MIPALRPFATNKKHRHRELNFDCRATDAPLPMYKSFFDPNLSTLWKSPAKRKHFHIVEHDVAQAEKIERSKQWDRERIRQDRSVIQQREAATALRMQQIGGQRQERIMKRELLKELAPTWNPKGNLPAMG